MLLTTLGVKTDNLNTEDNCILLDEAVHGGQYQWDISEHRLNLTIPQAYINELERGYVPRKVGIAALMLFIPPIILVSIALMTAIITVIQPVMAGSTAD